MNDRQMPCPCTGIAQDESCPIGFPSLLCQICNGVGHVPAVKLDGSELWEIVYSIADDVAHDITDEQYQQIADAINHVFIEAPTPETNVGVIRAAALEEAANVAETGDYNGFFQTNGDERRAKAIAARIRALSATATEGE